MTTNQWREVNPPKDYTNIELWEIGQKSVAVRRLNQAVKTGAIKKTNACQVCDAPGRTVAHHWNGHNHPFDVWWVCFRCNANLKYHDGSVTLEMAREIIAARYKRRKTPSLYRSWNWCDVCDANTKIGKYIDVAPDESMFLCEQCFYNLVGEDDD